MKLSSGCESCFAGLACGARIDIVGLLEKRKKMNVSEIAKHFRLSQPTITHHLQYLKAAGILGSQKEGRKVYYFIDPKCSSGDCDIF